MKKAATTSIAIVWMAALASAQRAPVEPSASHDRDGGAEGRNGVPAAAKLMRGDYRSFDGWGNNEANPAWGHAGRTLVRYARNDYADGSGAPAGSERRSAREISNLVLASPGSLPNRAGLSDLFWQWGQFLDHDLDETPIADPAEPFDVPVPLGDPYFDPGGTGTQVLPLDRSFHRMRRGVRQQVNDITAYIDASNVYGSDAERARALRTMDGTGRLRTSEGELLPFNEEGLPNAPDASERYFLAGDFRANEQVGLTAMHTLFVREHNHWAEKVAEFLDAHMPAVDGQAQSGVRRRRRQDHDRGSHVGLSRGEIIYRWTRAIVGAEMQAITYREFLPKLLGDRALAPYRGYDPAVDASIANEFATAAYRFGHSMLSPKLLRLESDGSASPFGHLSLAEAFFRPDRLIHEGGIDSLLRGLASQTAQEADLFVIDEVRNMLFGPPGAGGLDLTALNLQRGRDHGLASYADLRRALGLQPVQRFSDITRDPEVRDRLRAAYASVEDIDAWVGGLAEDDVSGALLGPTFRRLLVRQFEALRDGDRFWYQSYLPKPLVRLVEAQTLARIIRRNTAIGVELADDPLRVE